MAETWIERRPRIRLPMRALQQKLREMAIDAAIRGVEHRISELVNSYPEHAKHLNYWKCEIANDAVAAMYERVRIVRRT